MTYDTFSVVVVPFPFTDTTQTKKRPAIVLSSIEHQQQTGHVTLLMITSGKNSGWQSDYLIKHLEITGLTAVSIIRQKIFTLDNRLIIKSVGKLAKEDREETIQRLKQQLCL